MAFASYLKNRNLQGNILLFHKICSFTSFSFEKPKSQIGIRHGQYHLLAECNLELSEKLNEISFLPPETAI